MLSIKFSYLFAIAIGFILGYACRVLTFDVTKQTVKEKTKHVFPSDLEVPQTVVKDYDHLIEVKMETNDTYTYATISIDGVSGGREKTFVSYRVRDAVIAHALIVYDDAIDSEGKSRLEAIGASRRDDVYLVAGRRYKLVFKQPVSGGFVHNG